MATKKVAPVDDDVSQVTCPVCSTVNAILKIAVVASPCQRCGRLLMPGQPFDIADTIGPST